MCTGLANHLCTASIRDVKSSRTGHTVLGGGSFRTAQLPYGFQTRSYAVSQRWNVSGGDEPVVDHERRPVTVQIVLVVVRTVAVVMYEADLWTNGDHLCRGRPTAVGRPGPPCRSGSDRQRVERPTDVVNAEFEDCARSNDDLGADATEGAAVNR